MLPSSHVFFSSCAGALCVFLWLLYSPVFRARSLGWKCLLRRFDFGDEQKEESGEDTNSSHETARALPTLLKELEPIRICCSNGAVCTFFEDDYISRGTSGSFGKLRLGRLGGESSPSLTVIVKELLPKKGEVLTFTPRDSKRFEDSRILEISDAIPGQELFRVQLSDGSHAHAVRNSQTGRLEGLSLEQHLRLFGTHCGPESSDSSKQYPEMWSEFLIHRKMVRREIDALSRIPDHPNLIQAIGHGELIQKNILRTFIILPYFKNGDLHDRVVEGLVPNESAIALFRGILSGVAALHDAGLCHRDLKLENVLLADDGVTPVIADFGFCSSTRNPNGSCRRNHSLVGSEPIRAPEIWEHGTKLSLNVGRADLREGYNGEMADVWSLGIVFFNLLTRDNFFVYDSDHKRHRMVRAKKEDVGFQLATSKSLRLSSRISPAQGRILMKVIVADPMKRPSVRSIIEML